MKEKDERLEGFEIEEVIEEAKGIENTIFVALVFLAQGYLKSFDCDMYMLGEKYKVKGYKIGKNFRIDFIKVENERK